MTSRPPAAFPATSTGRVVHAVPVAGLRAHEEHDEVRALRLARHIGRVGLWTAPLVVERDSMVVMDGHHRLRAARALGLVALPAVLLAYGEGDVVLQAWRRGEAWSPADVLSCAATGRLLPRKTTRHLFQPAIGLVAVPLAWLAGPQDAGPDAPSPALSDNPTGQRPATFGIPS